MGSLLSSISGQFAKLITLGTLFPVVIISILNVVFVGPLVQSAAYLQVQLKRIAIGEDKWAIVTLTFVVVVLTGVLRNLNIPIIRLYEGYPWKESYIGELLTLRERKRFTQASSLRLSLRFLRRELRKAAPKDARLASMGKQQTALAQYLSSELPDREDLVLPTRFGNVIRCFERYSDLAYGMDAIVLWPRLVAKIDSGFASTIDEAKTSLDFMLNCSFLSAITAIAILAIKLSGSEPLTWTTAVPWLWRAGLFLTFAIAFYHFSIGRAKAWGLQVKAAFDLYRLDLLKALGYQQQPLYFEDEKALWQKISAQLLYADTRTTPLPYKDSPTKAIASPAGVQVTVTRQFQGLEANGNIQVELAVENSDSLLRRADAVRVIESVPEGYTCVFQSVRPPAGVRVSSLNPLEFICGPMDAGKKVVLTYGIRQAGA